jgi:hypothetical protein
MTTIISMSTHTPTITNTAVGTIMETGIMSIGITVKLSG